MSFAVRLAGLIAAFGFGLTLGLAVTWSMARAE